MSPIRKRRARDRLTTDNQALDAEPPIVSFLTSMLIGGGPVNADVRRCSQMKRLTYLLSMLAISITTVVIAGSDVSTYSWFKQKSWVSTASEEQLIETKRWSPKIGEPPIAVGEAIR